MDKVDDDGDDDDNDNVPQTNGMEQLRIEEEMQRHRTSHNTLDKHYANDDSRVHMYELAKPADPCSNRLSAPECGLKKSPLSNSLTDLCTGMHVACSSPHLLLPPLTLRHLSQWRPVITLHFKECTALHHCC